MCVRVGKRDLWVRYGHQSNKGVSDSLWSLLEKVPLVPQELDAFSTGKMREDGVLKAAAPECKGQLGWVYHKGHCYMFTSYHMAFLKAEEQCNLVGGYLADILTKEENDWIKSVLNVINPKDGTDYWIGGLDADKDKGMQWMTGK